MEPEAYYGPEIADFNQHHDPNDQVLSLPTCGFVILLEQICALINSRVKP